jgi:hypothetical protein
MKWTYVMIEGKNFLKKKAGSLRNLTVIDTRKDLTAVKFRFGQFNWEFVLIRLLQLVPLYLFHKCCSINL